MKGIKKVARGIGKVALALLAGVLMPILIWVALGVALNQKLRQSKPEQAPATIGEILTKAGLAVQEEATTGKPIVAKTFTKPPVSEMRELLARAGLSIHNEAVSKQQPEATPSGLKHPKQA